MKKLALVFVIVIVLSPMHSKSPCWYEYVNTERLDTARGALDGNPQWVKFCRKQAS